MYLQGLNTFRVPDTHPHSNSKEYMLYTYVYVPYLYFFHSIVTIVIESGDCYWMNCKHNANLQVDVCHAVRHTPANVHYLTDVAKFLESSGFCCSHIQTCNIIGVERSIIRGSAAL